MILKTRGRVREGERARIEVPLVVGGFLKYQFFLRFFNVFCSSGGPRWHRCSIDFLIHFGSDFGSILGEFWEAKLAPRRPKTAARRPKTPQHGPKMAPRCSQDGTRAVKRAMLKQVGFRMASERESIEKTNENHVFFVCRSVAFGRPRRPQDAPRRPHDAPRRVQDVPRWSQDAPKTAEDGPKMCPGRHQESE